MIQDQDVQEAFTRAYASHRAHPERAMPDGAEKPTDYVYRHPGILEAQARDRLAQHRSDKGLDRPREPRPVIEYRDPPVTAKGLALALEHYRHCLGEIKYFPLEKMAAMRLPLVVWQNIFSGAKTRAQQGQYLDDPASYVMRAAKKESRFAKVVQFD